MQNYNTECKSMVNRSEGEWKLLTTEEHKKNLDGEGNVLYHDYGDGFMIVQICQNNT